jgi:hypothetical protein
MKREILSSLVGWKRGTKRKPLILRGPRQVGKTWILRHFGETQFPAVHLINFEEDERFREVFEGDLRPNRILADLSLILRGGIKKDDLIIFDEIQRCPRALTSLKYFYEGIPGQAICAAGSLLGVILSTEAFPVGKVAFLDLYGFSFEEFLEGTGHEGHAQQLRDHDIFRPFSQVQHAELSALWKRYLVSGGMPEAIVALGMEHPTFEILSQVRHIQHDLIDAHISDIAKHSGKTNALHIERLWRNIPAQLSRSAENETSRFRFKDVIPGVRNYDRLAGPIDWLEGVGLILRVPIVETAISPLAAHTVENRFKLYFGDVGLLGTMSRLEPQTLLGYDFGSFKGYLVENAVAQALHTSRFKVLYAWQGRTSEVEFVIDTGGAAFPVEVKSGTVTHARSLGIFEEKFKPPVSIIVSGKNVWKSHGRIGIPLYACSKIPEIIRAFS